jgi:putative FmdB family regulatory protein
MPIYEYRCRKCDQRFELMRRLAARDDAAPCPHCKSRATTRVQMQRVAVITGVSPDAAAGEGEAGDFLDGGDDDFGGDWDDDF